MAGGLLQMVAYGLHDTMLTGNPQISFFKIVYRKHTKFYKESIEQTYTGDLTANNKISITLSKQGDLLSNLYLETTGTTYDLYSCIDHIDCLIGSQLIDRHYSHWMNLWNDLTNTQDKQTILNDIRRGSIQYTIPELKDEFNPLFSPPLTVGEIIKYPLPADFSVRNMYLYDMFIFIVKENVINDPVNNTPVSWVSRLTVSLNSDPSSLITGTINGTFYDQFVSSSSDSLDNFSVIAGITVHKNKLYVADNKGYLDSHNIDTNQSSSTYGSITKTKYKLIGGSQTMAELIRFNVLKPRVDIYGRSFEGFYIGPINSMHSTDSYILLSNNIAPFYIYKMYADFGDYTYKYNITNQTPTTSSFVGKTTYGYTNGSAALTTFNKPYNIAVHEEIDATTEEYLYTNIYISDRDNNVIRKWNRITAKTTTIAGNASALGSYVFADGDSSTATFSYPYDICITSNGRYIIVSDSGNKRIRKIDTITNTVTTLAGSNTSGSSDGYGSAASFQGLTAIDISPDDSYVLVCDNTASQPPICKIRKIIISTGEVSTIADSGTMAVGTIADTLTDLGCKFQSLSGISIDPLGNYALLSDGDGHNIYKIDLFASINSAAGTLYLIAGTSGPIIYDEGDADGVNGTALNSRFRNPSGIMINNTGEYALITDTGNSTIRKLYIDNFNTPSITTLVGTPGAAGEADGVIATFNEPKGIYINKLSTMAYVVDTDNNKIREVELAARKSFISTFYIYQYTSSLPNQVNHMVVYNNNMYIIYDTLPGIYLINDNPSNINTTYQLITDSDIYIKQGNSLSIKGDVIYATCTTTAKVYEYDIITGIFKDILGPETTDENGVVIVRPSSYNKPSGTIVTYYNDILVSEQDNSNDTGTIKILGIAKPYYIYHDVYDYQQAAYLPLQFWFCNSGLALPLISLGNTDVKIVIQFTDAISEVDTLKIWGDYIFLDEAEKKQFIHNDLEYLITQVQHSNTLRISENTVINNDPIDIYTITELSFQNPIKELIWTLYQTVESVSGSTKSTASTNQGGNQNIEMSSMYLQFNGEDRFCERDGKYFTKVQRYKYHTGAGIQHTRDGVPGDDIAGPGTLSKWFPTTINAHVYPFCIRPEATQPTGSCNFSNMSSVTMNMKYRTSQTNGKHNYDLDVYALNYNILKIKNGSASLLYAS